MLDVIRQRGAISFASNNRNYRTKKTGPAWLQAQKLATGTFTPHPEVVFYHDKSINMPESWSNRYYKAVPVKITEHFVFYKVVPRRV